jgi:hypothetical protein
MGHGATRPACGLDNPHVPRDSGGNVSDEDVCDIAAIFFGLDMNGGDAMDEKSVFIGLRTTPMERHAVQAYALAQGLTVSELIRLRIVKKAVRPVREAALAAEVEVLNGEVVDEKAGAVR